MSTSLKPIFLLADSQLLFYNDENGLFLERVKELFKQDKKGEEIKAVYIGASNNDNPKFYEIFKTAMQQINISNCHMIKLIPNNYDSDFLKSAEIILLAGGNTEKGWDIIKRNGWNKIIIDRYTKGAILIGVSAGAIQLGVKGYNDEDGENQSGFDTLQLVPFIIDVHANDDWSYLSKQVELEERLLKGYGIPYGAGIIYYPDMSIEAIRYPCIEINKDGKNGIKSFIISPIK